MTRFISLAIGVVIVALGVWAMVGLVGGGVGDAARLRGRACGAAGDRHHPVRTQRTVGRTGREVPPSARVVPQGPVEPA